MSGGDTESTFLGNPLRAWSNPDILYEEDQRKALALRGETAVGVIDWRQLREAFQRAETAAKDAKSRSRKLGGLAIALVGSGTALISAAPLLPAAIATSIMLVALFSILFGFGAGIAHMIQPGGHLKWLSERLKAERLRACYFHVLIDGFETAAHARTDAPSLEEWQQFRASKLDAALRRLSDEAADGWGSWTEDGDLRRVWVPEIIPAGLSQRESDIKARALAHPDEWGFVAGRIYEQRIQVQRSFTARATRPSISTAQGRRQLVRIAEWTGILGTPLIAAAAGISLIVRPHDLPVWISLMGATGAVGLVARLLDQGLQVRAEAQRYSDYSQRIKSVARKFEEALQTDNIVLQVEAVFDIERHAYWETRQFFLDHRNNRFFG